MPGLGNRPGAWNIGTAKPITGNVGAVASFAYRYATSCWVQDINASYSKRFGRYNWRVQINVNNLFDKDDLPSNRYTTYRVLGRGSNPFVGGVVNNGFTYPWQTNRPRRTHDSDHGGILQRTDDQTDQRPRDQRRPQSRNPKEGGAKQQPPHSAPERAARAPGLHPIGDIVVADHVLLGVIVPPDDRQFLHVESGFLQFPDRRFGVRMGLVNGDDGIVLQGGFGNDGVHRATITRRTLPCYGL